MNDDQPCAARTGARSLAFAAALALGLQPGPACPQPPAGPEMVSSRIQGIDVSHDQGTIDWTQVADAGKRFVFIKATQGITETDPHFQANWQGAKAAGLLRGAYHYYQPGDDPVKQAEHFLSVVSLEPGELPLVLDVETLGSQTASELVSGLRIWLAAVQKSTGATPIVYTDPGFWNGLGTSDFSEYPLWAADYNAEGPVLPAGWTAWAFWQYSESGTVSGISGPVDLDVFQGNIEELQKKP